MYNLSAVNIQVFTVLYIYQYIKMLEYISIDSVVNYHLQLTYLSIHLKERNNVI